MWASAYLLSLYSLQQLAARIAVSNLHKSTLKSFSETCVPPHRFPLALLLISLVSRVKEGQREQNF